MHHSVRNLVLVGTMLGAINAQASDKIVEPRLSYRVQIVPESPAIRIEGMLVGVLPGTYRFSVDRHIGLNEVDVIGAVEFRAGGRSLAVARDGSDWLVSIPPAAKGVTFSYDVHATVALEQLPANNAWRGTIPYVDHRMAFMSRYAFVIPTNVSPSGSVALHWVVPEGWNITSPWSSDPYVHHAPSLYALMHNYYIAYTDACVVKQSELGVDLTMVWTGVGCLASHPDAMHDIQRVFRSVIQIAGAETFADHVTVIMQDSGASGTMTSGTAGSSSIQMYFPRDLPFDVLWSYSNTRLLHTLAHELLHTAASGDDDLGANRSGMSDWGPQTCWIQEGFTEYLATMSLFRAGIIELDDVLNDLQRRQEIAQGLNPGAKMSIQEACAAFYAEADAFTYTYNDGALLAFALDTQLRVGSDGEKSLSYLTGRFYRRYADQEKQREDFLSEWLEYAHDPDGQSILSLLSRPGVIPIEKILLGLGGVKYVDANGRVAWHAPENAAITRYFSNPL